MAKTTKENGTIEIMEIKTGVFECCLLGKTPLVYNAMSAKAARELLMPKGPKNKAERASTLKHMPVQEYRDSVYGSDVETDPTYLVFPSPAFKGAIKSAALDIPGAAKAQIGRLVWVDGYRVPVWGIPVLGMDIVRNSDMNHTPDVRTRAFVGEWATRIKVKFAAHLLKEQSIANLIAAAGIFVGVGDWRQQKGSGNFGSFDMVSEDDPEFKRIVAAGGRVAQMEAMENPEARDADTAKLLTWFGEEAKKRGHNVVTLMDRQKMGERAVRALESERKAV